MKKIILLFSGLLSVSFSQVISNDAMLFNNLVSKINELERTSVSIEIIDTNFQSPTTIGSGFFLVKKDNYYAVTNFHVINNLPKNKILIIGMNDNNKKKYAFSEKVFTDAKHDIAVIKISIEFSLKNKSYIDTTIEKSKAAGMSLFETNKNIQNGIGIITIGYPLGIGSEYSGNQPISRIGIVAQSVNDSTGTFFIDGISSHGNSGSPVYNAQNMKLLGMIIGFPSDYITAYDENKQIIAKLPYNSGLSLCVSADMIKKLIP